MLARVQGIEHFYRLLVRHIHWDSFFRRNFDNEIFFDPAIPCLGIYHTDYFPTCSQMYMNKDIH